MSRHPASRLAQLGQLIASSFAHRRIAGVLAFTLAGGGIALVSARTADEPSYQPPRDVGDTVVVFGPQEMTTTAGNTTHYAEDFTVSLEPGRQYLLKVVNGTPAGQERVTGGSVALNGIEILDATILAAGGAEWIRVVEIRAVDTLEVDVVAGGGSAAKLTISVLAISDPTLTMFSERFTRASGPPTTVTRFFSVPANVGPPHFLCYTNGNADGSDRVTSGTVTLNGTVVLNSSGIDTHIGGLCHPVTLQAQDTVQVQLQGTPGDFIDLRFIATDTAGPTLTITAPALNLVTSATQLATSGTYSDQTAVAITVNGVEATLGGGSSWSATVPLSQEGNNTITVHAVDAAGNDTDSTRVVVRDTQAPALTLTSPANDLATPNSSIQYTGTVTDATALTLNVNGTPITITAGAFSQSVALPQAVNVLVLTATDAANNTSSITRTITVDAVKPALTITEPADNSTTIAENVMVRGTVTDATALTLTVNGVATSIVSNAYEREVALAIGPNTIAVIATDAAGNDSTLQRTVTRNEDLPPDPATVAPPLNPALATNLFSAMEFLFTGADPIQTGVSAGTISPTRLTVVRGRVVNRNAQVVTGATIRVVGHAEFGETKTRADGRFDIAVNGGAQLTIEASKTGLLPVQRALPTKWQHWITLDSLVMIPLDTAVTTIDFSSPIEVARGSVVTDADGTRQATLMFKQGTTANLVFPNDSTQPITTLNVRATEYTVGELGEAAMPGTLPVQSAYTYAAELSVDEAIAAGARQVTFSQPVSFYLENFLNMPVGAIVPVGWYDGVSGTWKPELDGRVIKIVSVTDTVANIAVTLAGTPASQAVLDSMGFTLAERVELATRYAVNTTLWRSRHSHFSRFDLNFSFRLPGWSFGPSTDPNRNNANRHDNDACEASGSIIDCQNQSLGESLGIAGTPFTLNYRSDRAHGFRGNRRITIPAQIRTDTTAIKAAGWIVRNQMPSTVLSVRYTMEVAGKQIVAGPFNAALSIPATTLEWDGLDAAGRRVLGQARAQITMEFSYPNLLVAGAGSGGGSGVAFASSGESTTPIRNGRRTVALVQAWDGMLGSWDARAQGLGGWSLSDHHMYDPTSGVLYTGDGRRREAQGMGQTVHPMPAVPTPTNIYPGADNFLYVSYFTSHAVGRVLSDGTGSFPAIAGINGQPGYSGEGVTATSSKLNQPWGVAIGPDGLVYIADGANHRIRRIDADGKLRTIAGTGSNVSSGNGGPALQAGISQPRALAFLPDGSLLFTEQGFNLNWIRRIDPNGRVTRFAGVAAGTLGTAGDGGPATLATLNTQSLPGSLAVGPDGSVYVQNDVEQGRGIVRRITPDGNIFTVAGRRAGFAGPSPATQVHMFGLQAIAVTPDGELRIGRTDGRVYGVTEDGQIRTVAGTFVRCIQTSCFAPLMNTGLATQFVFHEISRLAVMPDGRLIVGDEDSRTRWINAAMPGFNENDILVASEDGSVAYQFNQHGRHLRTLDAASRDTILEFTYDGSGWLTSIKDADGLITTIERSGQAVSAIEGPFGQRTTFTLDTGGFLATVTNPKGERVTLTTSASTGFLSALLDPRQGRYAFTYDSIGRLAIDTSAAGYVQTLSRVQTDTSVTVTKTDNLGRTNIYRTDFLGVNKSRSTIANPAGLVTVATTFDNDSTIVVTPDSTTVMSVRMGDFRFGAQSPVLRQTKVTLPSGLTSVMTGGQTGAMTNVNDPLSITTITDSVLINGRKFKSTYARSTRTVVTTSPVGRTTTTVYDTAGRVIKSAVPGVPTDTFSYNANGQLTQAKSGGRISTFAYDNKGRLLSSTDPLGSKDSLFYDNADRLTRRVLPDNREVLFAYDSSGNLTSVTPPGRPAHTFEYAPADRLANYNPPSWGLPVSATSYGYNAAGQVTVIRRPTGDSLRFTYDNAGRSASVIFDRGTTSFTYNGTTGNLTSLTAPGSLGLAFTYDGSLPKSVTWSGTVAGSVGVTYDANFRVTGQTVNGANSVSFGYDNDDLLTSAGGLGLRRNTTTGQLDADSIIVSGNTQKTTYSYDAHGALSAMLAKRGNDTLFATNYTRDSLSRITTLIERINGVTDTIAFAYDSVGRLKTVTRDGVASAAYTYGLNGNRASKTTSGGTVNGTYDDQDRLTAYGNTTYQYTAHGDLLKKIVGNDTTEYTYDALGNLTQAALPNDTTIEYLIDARNRRLGQKVNGSLKRAWLYQGQLTPVAELDSAGNVVSRFVYGTGINVPDYMARGDSTYRLIRDHVGSVRVVVNVASGTIAQRISYDEFGVETENTNPDWQPFGFAGGLSDAHTGFVRFGARDYDGVLGRWTTKDPIGFDGGDENLYAYVGNDPVSFIDPRGFGRVGLLIRTVKGAWHWISRPNALRRLDDQGVRILVEGAAPSKQARKLAKEKWGRDAVRHDGHQPGQRPHYQHRNGGRGKIMYSLSLLGMAGVCTLGDNLLGHLVDFFNPFSDLNDIVGVGSDIFGGSDGGDVEPAGRNEDGSY